MKKEHFYRIEVEWTGNKGTGTSSYKAYDRSHTIKAENKTEILCSSDPYFLGDKSKYNPEEMLLASLSACHMLWYLHLCAEAGIIVLEYTDKAMGIMTLKADGGGHFEKVILFPVVTITGIKMVDKALALHKKANELCFIANSVNFPISHNPIFCI